MAGAGIKLETGHVLEERYLLERVIGQGGMGTVFAAKHLELGEMVAVKVLQSESAFATLEAEHLERFLREARLSARIKNDHVVRVIDVSRGKDGSPPFIVMELLEGIDLGDLVHTRGKVPYPEAIAYILQACDALAEAHALGITHRDLKSSNLHLSYGAGGLPIVKVLDFGISKTNDDESDMNLTSTSSVFGSPAYMSPEQIRSAKHVDHRTDVWAMAVVLYELITADLPFTGNSASAMLAGISADPPIPLRHFAPDAPAGLEQAINAALTKNRDERTPNIVAFAASIAPFVPDGAMLLSAVHRAAGRVTGRSGSGPVPVPVPLPFGSGNHVSDTMRASDPVMAEATGNRSAYARSDSVAAAPVVGNVTTDREMVVPPRPATTPAIAIALVAVGMTVTFGAIALFLLFRPVHAVAAPSSAVSVVVAEPPPPTSAEPAPSAAVSSVAVAPAPHPSAPVAKPHPHHPVSPAPAVPSSKPNGIPDTSSRE